MCAATAIGVKVKADGLYRCAHNCAKTIRTIPAYSCSYFARTRTRSFLMYLVLCQNINCINLFKSIIKKFKKFKA